MDRKSRGINLLIKAGYIVIEDTANQLTLKRQNLFDKAVAQDVLEYGKKLGYTVVRTASLSNVSPNALYSWASGRAVPKADNCAKLLALRDRLSKKVAQLPEPDLRDSYIDRVSENLENDQGVRMARRVNVLRKHLKIPVYVICKELDCSRQMFWFWVKGKRRPKEKDYLKLLALADKLLPRSEAKTQEQVQQALRGGIR